MNINELVMALKSDGIHLHSGQTVSVINNDRTLWLPATVVHVANYSSYIVRVIGQAEYRRIWDHIHECHLDAVKLDMHTKVEVSRQPVITPSISETVQRAPTDPTEQPLIVPTTLEQAAAWNHTAATCTPVDDLLHL